MMDERVLQKSDGGERRHCTSRSAWPDSASLAALFAFGGFFYSVLITGIAWHDGDTSALNGRDSMRNENGMRKAWEGHTNTSYVAVPISSSLLVKYVRRVTIVQFGIF